MKTGGLELIQSTQEAMFGQSIGNSTIKPAAAAATNGRPVLLTQSNSDGNKNFRTDTATTVKSSDGFYTSSKNSSTEKVLALLTPPGMVGGYRNQFIRFVALVKYAQQHNIRQLLLPSMLWSTTYRAARKRNHFYPVPMDLLFDIEYWNSFENDLPILVDSIHDGGEDDITSDCWQPYKGNMTRHMMDRSLSHDPDNSARDVFVSPMTDSILETSGYLTPIMNETTEYLNGLRSSKPRKIDLYPKVRHCQHPKVVGGGKAAGFLWNLYSRMPKVNLGDNNTEAAAATRNTALIAMVSTALRPSKKWRTVAHECITHYLDNYDFGSSGGDDNIPPYLALHARVEVDMMVHKCGAKMEKNLSTIFDMVDPFVHAYNTNHTFSKSPAPLLRGVFVAVSRNSMRLPEKSKYIQNLSKQNWEVLNERSPQEVENNNPDKGSNKEVHLNEKTPTFECGENWVDRWYQTQQNIPEDYYGSILPSILNFYIATQATVFVGVDKSSWSTDVWTTRYLLGKGRFNYKYTIDKGIIPVLNGGLPEPHKNC
jgi:hypothetical protein